MQYSRLGNTGLIVSRLAFGAMTFGTDTRFPSVTKVDTKGARALVSQSLEAGINFFDTADGYAQGQSEVMLGELLRDRRQDVVIATKVGFRSGEPMTQAGLSRRHILASCDASLKRLKTDYLDVYVLHWWSGAHPIADTMRAMEELVVAGKIRSIGVSNLDVDQLKQAQKALSREKIVCNQVLYHLRSRGIERRLLPYCESQNIAVVGYSPFGQGDFPSSGKQGKALQTIADRHGKTTHQVALSFLTRRESLFAIPKAGQADHARENAGGIGWTLTAEDLKLIDSAFPAPSQDQPLDML